MNVECFLAVKFWQERASDARLWKALTPSRCGPIISLHWEVYWKKYCQALTVGRGWEMKVNFWNAGGKKNKCKFGGRAGGGGVPSALLKKINWIPRTDFVFGKLLSRFRVGYCKWYFMLSFWKWKSRNVLYILCCCSGASHSGKTTCFFHRKVTAYTYSTCGSSSFTSSMHKTWHLHSACSSSWKEAQLFFMPR